MSTIDIVTITCNNYNGVKKTFKSIIDLNFNLKDLHWIVIDSLSVDDTKNYIDSMVIKYGSKIKITYVYEKDKGIYDGMNKAIPYLISDYAIFLNAGDVFYKNESLRFFNGDRIGKPSYVLIYGNYFRELKNGNLAKVKAKPIKYIYHSLPTSHQAIFYNSNVLREYQYDLNYQVCGDYDLTSRIIVDYNLIHSNKYKIINDMICIFEYNGVSRNNLQKLFDEASLIQKKVLKLNRFYSGMSYYFKVLRNKLL